MKIHAALAISAIVSLAQAEPDRAEIESAMRRAAGFFVSEVSRHGGYVYYVSPDLGKRLGEGPATEDQVWVQPPATPSVGMAFLDAFQSTGDRFYLKAATGAAGALLYGQLESGAWTNSIDFSKDGPGRARYRDGRGNRKGRNFSTLDDDISTSALRFLMRLDRAADGKLPEVKEGVEIALTAMLGAQYPNGAFPQGWDEEPRRAGGDPRQRASIPADWRKLPKIKAYWDCYTLNDGVVLNVTRTLIEADKHYARKDCTEALRRLGEFLARAQLPEPQPGWAQQYDDLLQPAWARKFEPPAIAGRETESAITALLLVSRHLGDRDFLKPVPAALDYLERSLLPDGRLARYYELGSNKPLYMERDGKDYKPTHDDSRLPDHYGWKEVPRVADLRRDYQALLAGKSPVATPREEGGEAEPVDGILKSLDPQGRWISRYAGESLVGQPKFKANEAYIDSGRFCRNLTALSRCLR